MPTFPVTIKVDDKYDSTCARNCPFMNEVDSHCYLFNANLEDTELPPGHEWNDCAPTKHRCWPCEEMTL